MAYSDLSNPNNSTVLSLLKPLSLPFLFYCRKRKVEELIDFYYYVDTFERTFEEISSKIWEDFMNSRAPFLFRIISQASRTEIVDRLSNPRIDMFGPAKQEMLGFLAKYMVPKGAKEAVNVESTVLNLLKGKSRKKLSSLARKNQITDAVKFVEDVESFEFTIMQQGNFIWDNFINTTAETPINITGQHRNDVHLNLKRLTMDTFTIVKKVAITLLANDVLSGYLEWLDSISDAEIQEIKHNMAALQEKNNFRDQVNKNKTYCPQKKFASPTKQPKQRDFPNNHNEDPFSVENDILKFKNKKQFDPQTAQPLLTALPDLPTSKPFSSPNSNNLGGTSNTPNALSPIIGRQAPDKFRENTKEDSNYSRKPTCSSAPRSPTCLRHQPNFIQSASLTSKKNKRSSFSPDTSPRNSPTSVPDDFLTRSNSVDKSLNRRRASSDFYFTSHSSDNILKKSQFFSTTNNNQQKAVDRNERDDRFYNLLDYTFNEAISDLDKFKESILLTLENHRKIYINNTSKIRIAYKQETDGYKSEVQSLKKEIQRLESKVEQLELQNNTYSNSTSTDKMNLLLATPSSETSDNNSELAKSTNTTSPTKKAGSDTIIVIGTDEAEQLTTETNSLSKEYQEYSSSQPKKPRRFSDFQPKKPQFNLLRTRSSQDDFLIETKPKAKPNKNASPKKETNSMACSAPAKRPPPSRTNSLHNTPNNKSSLHQSTKGSTPFVSPSLSPCNSPTKNLSGEVQIPSWDASMKIECGYLEGELGNHAGAVRLRRGHRIVENQFVELNFVD